eukprot:4798083-Pleurochrysis_carterae.AAC.4
MSLSLLFSSKNTDLDSGECMSKLLPFPAPPPSSAPVPAPSARPPAVAPSSCPVVPDDPVLL